MKGINDRKTVVWGEGSIETGVEVGHSGYEPARRPPQGCPDTPSSRLSLQNTETSSRQ